MRLKSCKHVCRPYKLWDQNIFLGDTTCIEYIKLGISASNRFHYHCLLLEVIHLINWSFCLSSKCVFVVIPTLCLPVRYKGCANVLLFFSFIFVAVIMYVKCTRPLTGMHLSVIVHRYALGLLICQWDFKLEAILKGKRWVFSNHWYNSLKVWNLPI